MKTSNDVSYIIYHTNYKKKSYGSVVTNEYQIQARHRAAVLVVIKKKNGGSLSESVF
jgi:repressor of nif and glnA expression